MSPRLGQRMARFNGRVTNRITRPFARRLIGFGVVVHRGRRSNREYETPVNVFRQRDGYVIALTYGTDSEWVKNVRAAGWCELVTRGQRRRLASPELRHDESLSLVPAVVRPALRILRVTDFMYLRDAGADGASPTL
jgi:deazaflavin-dependent oxidoreductase (nitroreductase family)